MKKKLWFLALLMTVVPQCLWAVDMLDVFRFHRPVGVRLQPEAFFYDVAKPHGVMSPLTPYVCRLSLKALRAKSMRELRDFSDLAEAQGSLTVSFSDPKAKAAMEDKVVRRNYMGLRAAFRVNRPVDEVFLMVTDYDHMEHLLPGVEESRIVLANGNHAEVDNWRISEALFLGSRKSYHRTSNIFLSREGESRRLIRSQLMKGADQDPNGGQQSLIFLDSLWTLESCGPSCTEAYYLSFTLLHWDWRKTPPVFPLMAKEVRKQLVTAALEGAARSILSLIVKSEDPRFGGKRLAELTPQDKELISGEVEERLKKLTAEGRIKINWKEVFGPEDENGLHKLVNFVKQTDRRAGP
jgi:hypothetical protein